MGKDVKGIGEDWTKLAGRNENGPAGSKRQAASAGSSRAVACSLSVSLCACADNPVSHSGCRIVSGSGSSEDCVWKVQFCCDFREQSSCLLKALTEAGQDRFADAAQTEHFL